MKKRIDVTLTEKEAAFIADAARRNGRTFQEQMQVIFYNAVKVGRILQEEKS